jgi:hypothetical protein
VLARKTWIVVGVVALAGCGGSSDDQTPSTTAAATASTSTTSTTTSTASSTVPEAAQPVTELVGQIERLTTPGDCAQTVKLIHPADLIEPEGGPSAANCQAIQSLVNGLPSFKPSDSVEYGTGALIEGVSAGNPIVLEAALDQTKNFKLTGGSTRAPQIDTEAPPDVDFEAPAAAFVKALRDDDCKSAHAAIAPISRLADANLKQFCSAFEGNFTADPSGLGARLKADPNAELVDLGGTRNTHFFALATNPAGYRTIFVGTVEHGEPLVLDVLPVER